LSHEYQAAFTLHLLIAGTIAFFLDVRNLPPAPSQ